MSSGIIVLKIERVISQRLGEEAFNAMVMSRNKPTKCGRCGRGIIVQWKMGEEPKVLNCRVCRAKTGVTFIGMMGEK